MNSTSISLLDRLRESDDSLSWERLFRLYAPLLRLWLRKYDVQATDVDDLVQEVLMAVSTDVKAFDHNGRPGAFRAWLRTILTHRLRNYWRKRDRGPKGRGGSDMDLRLEQLEDPASQLSQIWNRQHDRHVTRQLLEMSESSFSPSTWTAFRRVALEGAKPDMVAAQLGISVNAVFIAKSRVLRRLRQEAEGLVESSSTFFGNR